MSLHWFIFLVYAKNGCLYNIVVEYSVTSMLILIYFSFSFRVCLHRGYAWLIIRKPYVPNKLRAMRPSCKMHRRVQ